VSEDRASANQMPDAAVVLTQVVVPQALAGACALEKIAIDAVPTEIGCVAVCRSAAPGDPEAAARVISSALAKTSTPVILVVQRGGQMTATRWEGGEEKENRPAALVLADVPAEIEGLLFGMVRVDDLPGVVTSAGVSSWGAARMLAGVARAKRKAARGAARDTANGPA
jgi:hypothetical protein